MGQPVEVIKEIYKNTMDNRIFNNLKQQLNEMIEDERSLISVEEFRKMFYTYFKGEAKAGLVYEKLLPCILVYIANDELFYTKPQEYVKDLEERVSIVKLTQFIDGFNFYPLRINSIKGKNDSTEVTYIMSSNTVGSLKAAAEENKELNSKHRS